MALSDLVLPTHTCKVGTGSFSVRGLGASDVEWLLANHKKEVEYLFDAGKTLGEQALDDDAALEGFLRGVIKELPAVIAGIIACASDDTGEAAVSVAGRLPLPVQLEALMAISRLTFEETGGVKKFADALKSLVGGATKTLSRS